MLRKVDKSEANAGYAALLAPVTLYLLTAATLLSRGVAAAGSRDGPPPSDVQGGHELGGSSCRAIRSCIALIILAGSRHNMFTTVFMLAPTATGAGLIPAAYAQPQ